MLWHIHRIGEWETCQKTLLWIQFFFFGITTKKHHFYSCASVDGSTLAKKVYEKRIGYNQTHNSYITNFKIWIMKDCIEEGNVILSLLTEILSSLEVFCRNFSIWFYALTLRYRAIKIVFVFCVTHPSPTSNIILLNEPRVICTYRVSLEGRPYKLWISKGIIYFWNPVLSQTHAELTKVRSHS